jgi:hypothetical protein
MPEPSLKNQFSFHSHFPFSSLLFSQKCFTFFLAFIVWFLSLPVQRLVLRLQFIFPRISLSRLGEMKKLKWKKWKGWTRKVVIYCCLFDWGFLCWLFLAFSSGKLFCDFHENGKRGKMLGNLSLSINWFKELLVKMRSVKRTSSMRKHWIFMIKCFSDHI